jgi:hypothetical protein
MVLLKYGSRPSVFFWNNKVSVPLLPLTTPLYSITEREHGVANICNIYSKGIKEKLSNYWAAWLPTTRYELGDIGILSGYRFEKIGSLTELKIPFTHAVSNSPNPIELVSASGVSFALKLAGDINEAFANIPKGRAGVKIDFGSEGAFIVECPATYEPAVADPMALQAKIIDSFAEGQWQADWAVIVRIVTAPTATILISNSTSAGLELAAEADLSAGLVDIGKSEVGLSVRSQTGEIMKMIGARDVTPFFQRRRDFG